MSKSLAYMPAPVAENEPERLRALQAYEVLDTAPERELDDLAALASQICGAPIALISLVDSDRQWFKAKVGLDTQETPRDVSFCGHAIHANAAFVVEDASADPRFRENPLVTGAPHVRFYAGAQLKASTGESIGTLCVIDHEPRKLDPGQIRALDALARQVVTNFERRRLERQLVQRERFIKGVVDGIPDLVSYWDRQGRVGFLNESFRRWFGADASVALGRAYADAFGSDLHRWISDAFDRARAGEAVEAEGLVKFVVDGREKEAHVAARLAPDVPEGGAFVIMTDQSASKRVQAQAFAASRLVSLGEVAGGVAHEVNNPLAIVCGRAGLLKSRIGTDRFDPAKAKRDLELIEASAGRIAKIVKSLQTFASSRRGEPRSVMPAANPVEAALDLCRERFKIHEVELHVAKRDDARIVARQGEIEEAVVNMLSNAFDAVAKLDEKWVRVDLGCSGADVEIRVTDSGRGIAPAVAAKMMHPFFTTKDVGQGAGLGLSVCKGIADSHGGDFFYDPSSLRTSFVLRLPKA